MATLLALARKTLFAGSVLFLSIVPRHNRRGRRISGRCTPVTPLWMLPAGNMRETMTPAKNASSSLYGLSVGELPASRSFMLF